jgi:hypothetical protein
MAREAGSTTASYWKGVQLYYADKALWLVFMVPVLQPWLVLLSVSMMESAPQNRPYRLLLAALNTARNYAPQFSPLG